MTINSPVHLPSRSAWHGIRGCVLAVFFLGIGAFATLLIQHALLQRKAAWSLKQSPLNETSYVLAAGGRYVLVAIECPGVIHGRSVILVDDATREVIADFTEYGTTMPIGDRHLYRPGGQRFASVIMKEGARKPESIILETGAPSARPWEFVSDSNMDGILDRMSVIHGGEPGTLLLRTSHTDWVVAEKRGNLLGIGRGDGWQEASLSPEGYWRPIVPATSQSSGH